MRTHEWVSLILHVAGKADRVQLTALATQLAAAQRANEILRAKGYGGAGTTIDAAAAMVPTAAEGPPLRARPEIPAAVPLDGYEGADDQPWLNSY